MAAIDRVAVRTVLRRRVSPNADNSTLSAGGVTVSLLRHRVTRAGRPIELHKTEIKLLAVGERN